MPEIRLLSSRDGADALLLSCVVDTNESLRQRALRLVNLGCSQKIMADKMGMAPSTFSKWLNNKAGIGPADLPALDGFNAYVQELADAIAADAIRQDALGGVVRKQSGDQTDETAAVPASAAERGHSLRARVDRAVGAQERGETVEPSARAARATREPPPAARARATGRGARDRKVGR